MALRRSRSPTSSTAVSRYGPKFAVATQRWPLAQQSADYVRTASHSNIAVELLEAPTDSVPGQTEQSRIRQAPCHTQPVYGALRFARQSCARSRLSGNQSKTSANRAPSTFSPVPPPKKFANRMTQAKEEAKVRRATNVKRYLQPPVLGEQAPRRGASKREETGQPEAHAAVGGL
jgi:hypothetical protein